MKSKKVITYAIILIAFIIVDLIHAMYSYNDFKATYGDKAFSDGVIGVLICNCVHIVAALCAITLFVLSIKKYKKSTKK